LMLIAFAPSENDLKKCKNISVGIFQPFHVWIRFQTNQFLPPKSIAT
jgi:hypothetical protein